MDGTRTERRLHGTAVAALRRRSVVAALGTVALVLASAVVAVAVLLPARTVAGRPASDAERAEVYLALLGRTARSVFIIDHSCGDVSKDPSLDCSGPPIPGGVQDRIRAALGGGVRFGSAPPPEMQPDLRSMIVAFGDLTMAGNHARLSMEYFCGPLCGNGTTYLLARAGGEWHVTGHEWGWIS